MGKNIKTQQFSKKVKALSILIVLILVSIPASAFGASILQETPEPVPEPDAVVPESGQQIFLEDTWWFWTVLIVISLLILLTLYFRARSSERPGRPDRPD
jgi:hypothetical protein